MDILETWQNERGEIYAIVGEPDGSYVPMWEDHGELFDFGGSPLLSIARFGTIDDARNYLLEGFENQDRFTESLEVKPSPEDLPF